jgi:transposase
LMKLAEPLLAVRERMIEQLAVIEQQLSEAAQDDAVCRRLMTAPGVGPITALTFRSGVDEPARFTRSRDVAAHFGLTPAANQSGERDIRGRISRRGDAAVRQALFIAAVHQLRGNTKGSWLKEWTAQVAARRGRRKAIVGAARRLAVILHRMWVTETDFRWESAVV